mmetsp:Transcript_24435/g.77446  ORF Transcript_24435/g.77446 Transcript_24435/m.77446 type:complete len:220 (-) Transcript_24435:857-1516(-)
MVWAGRRRLHRLVQLAPQHPRRLEGAARRRRQVARHASLEGALVQLPLAVAVVHHRDPVAREFVRESVVQHVVRRLAPGLVPARPRRLGRDPDAKLLRRLDLQPLDHQMLEGGARRCDRVAPHLEHPVELGVRLAVPLHVEGDVDPPTPPLGPHNQGAGRASRAVVRRSAVGRPSMTRRSASSEISSGLGPTCCTRAAASADPACRRTMGAHPGRLGSM